MRLSTKGRYAVMAMADLAGHEARKSPRFAGRDRRTAGNLALLPGAAVRQIAQGGLVTSVRGPGGGYRLSPAGGGRPRRRHHPGGRRADDGDALQTGQRQRLHRHGARCVTHDLWEELGRQIHVFLSSVSLADVVEKRVLGRAKPAATRQPREAA